MIVDFSQELRLLSGKPVTGPTSGLPSTIFQSEEDWAKPMTLSKLVELLLLYTRGLKDNEEIGSAKTALPRDEKMNRFALALKVRDGGKVDLTERDTDTLRLAITALPIEQYGIVAMACGIFEEKAET